MTKRLQDKERGMDIRVYKEYRSGEILPLYASVGWTAYTSRPEMLERAFAGSLLVLGAYEDESLVALLRAVGDGASMVFIQDILVQPEYQRRGIGSALLAQAMEHFKDVYQLRLAADAEEKTLAFYRSCGFAPDSDTGCMGFSRVTY